MSAVLELDLVELAAEPEVLIHHSPGGAGAIAFVYLAPERRNPVLSREPADLRALAAAFTQAADQLELAQAAGGGS